MNSEIMSDYNPPKKKFKSSIDILPNEIFLNIFDYLTSNDIIYSFINCNQRLQNLLLTQKYHLKTPRTNLHFWNKTLPIIDSQIQTLIIHNDYLTVSLDFFPNLTSIIISSPYSLLDGQLKSILNHQYFEQLNTFKIKDIVSIISYKKDVIDDEQILFQTIFNNKNKLQVFEYLPQLGYSSHQKFDKLNLNIHIHSLTLNFIDFYHIFTIIQNTPNLIYLNIQTEMPYKQSKQHQLTDISQIKLEKLYFKFKRYNDCQGSYGIIDCKRLFFAIQLFSSSLITLSLNLIDIDTNGLTDILFNGIELENKLLKSMNKLENFHFYARIYKCNDAQDILSTFKTFPWSIGIHQNTFIYTLPFPFHDLQYFRHFQNVLSNNDEILKHHHQLWSKVTSLKLICTDQIDFNNLFPLIKLNMPNLLSIIFCIKESYNFSHSDNVDTSSDEFKRINIQFDNVTNVAFEDISMKQFQQILMFSFPNLQCLILNWTDLPSKKKQLYSFLIQKIQRIEFYESSLNESYVQEKDLWHFSNLKHLKLSYYGRSNRKDLNNRSQIIERLLRELKKLEILTIYSKPSTCSCCYRPESVFKPIMNGLDEEKIKTKYDIKYSGDYMRFRRNIES